MTTPSGSPTWAWYLANTADLSKIGLLASAQNKTINLTLNDRESATFELSLLDAMVQYLDPIATCVLCYRDGQLVWSGPVFTLQKDVPNMLVEVRCLGWLEYLNHWLLPTANQGPAHTFLTVSMNSGDSITVIPIPPYRGQDAVPAGTTVTVTDPTGTHTQTYTLPFDLVPGGDLVPVLLQPANYSYPVGSSVDIAAPNGGYTTIGTMTATTLSYVGVDQCQIVADLIGLYQQDAVLKGAMAYVTLGDVPITGLTRNITYQQYQNIGQAIQALSQVESGFDFHVDPITRRLDMFFDPLWPPGSVGPYAPNPSGLPVAGVNGRGQVRSNALFGYHTGPQNVATLTETTDATQLVNKAYVVSQFGTGTYQDAGSIQKYGVFDEQLSITDNAAIQPDVLNAYAAIEVLTKSEPLRIWTFNQNPYSPGSSAFQPFGVDFDVGDFCSLISDYGIIIPGPGAGQNGKMPIRIFGYSVTISNEGVEAVTNVATTFQSQS